MIKAIVFDIGQTLTYYPIPLNWSKLYRPAFEAVSNKLGFDISEEEYSHIGNVLIKYNARINPRDVEVSSDEVFGEILEGTNIKKKLINDIKREFYSFFRTDVKVYPEADPILKELKRKNILLATLSDVPYGMDNEYALGDLGELVKYIDLPYTSNDIGYRKPLGIGLIKLAEEFHINPSELVFVGDEIKDIECAHNAGAKGILINRSDEDKNFGQDYMIKDLNDLMELVSIL
ncbi:putative hydrolase of the HAD superfamily [Lachnospiraceae bacterium G41]|nr:putative hydrolase of the HAD superfamily [Lachnospiraceae bacterium G41]